jgi:hypothetical protein
MPPKGTKKVRGHIRRKYMVNDPITGLKIEGPFAKRTRVRDHYRKKPKQK